MKVFLHALQPWSHPSNELMGPGLAGRDRGHLGRDDDLRQLRRAGPAQLQADARLLVDRPRRLHARRRGRGQRLDSRRRGRRLGALYLVVYAFANVGAFAVAAWLVRDKKTDEIDDLNGLGMQSPLLAICILLLMLSLIGIPPFAGFFGKLYMFMEALNQEHGRDPADADRPGGAGALELGGLGVLLRAGAQGDVPPRARRGARLGLAEPVRSRFRSRSVRWSPSSSAFSLVL